MPDTLAEICAAKREHVRASKQRVSESEIRARAAEAFAPRGFIRALRREIAGQGNALIAEIKKASPSKGIIREDFSPPDLARAYALGGAACLSVLTDVPYFQGSDNYLMAARESVHLPVLRKDFMLDPYQIAESRALGADCVLLIMAALSDAQAQELEAQAIAWEMDVLIEVHDEAEMERAFLLKSELIGINNRNLKTLEVNLATAERLVKMIPGGYLGVCESGIFTHADVLRMNRAGLRCFLVGESLMREADVAQAARELLGKP
ncbi:MAG: indole-3-glycerol phosphate synthase TrpC [Alphaproteobacteria bacterium]|nr:indole-3-glycerol phosphate synthase TrpC [Alphaproteobacteria bacterium]